MIGSVAARRRGALIIVGIVAFAVPASAAAPTIAALAKLEKGRWQVRELDNAVAPTALCLGDPARLLRFEHRAVGGCASEILGNGPASATVQYNCRGRGFGHSTLRVETPRSVRVDTQGMSGGRPFSYRLEAQRIGTC
jgi:hypothetical protein